MNKIMERGARLGKKHACAFAAVALISMMSGCQSMDATKTSSIGTKPVVHSLGQRVHYAKDKRLHLINRKPLTKMTNVTRTREEAYAAFVRPHRVGRPATVKVSYSLGNGGPLLGHSPWICGPSGFGQRASCRSRY
ncbi:hypothetical protein LB519_28240 [Mesorhizobium sp. AD1-1]|uniref:hypothetical protein n=1 Tax=Mesorhizobium sp. AD1-1 TaxID=2876621 RepID=UPI001CCBED36|nr:hypothetical protein [Mesorhizobium sp. AD1-1]MBZ9721739.1 hypothetical protein [Mesorhizobium sp. AD1-1]